MASKMYLELLEEAKDLHIRKNAGYSGADNPDPWANFRMSEEFGVEAWRGALVRMSDKYIRIVNLVKNADNEQVGESIEDTLKDLSAYALITLCLLREKREAAEVDDNIPFDVRKFAKEAQAWVHNSTLGDPPLQAPLTLEQVHGHDIY